MPCVAVAVVGTLWSAVATIESMRQGLRPASCEALEGLRAGHLVHEVAVDVDERGPVGSSWTRWESQSFS